MDILFKAVLVLHFVGLGMIVGGALHQWGEKALNVTMVMVWGARAQVVTGLALVGLIYANDGEPNNWKIATKFIIALTVTALAEIFRSRAGNQAKAWWAILGLTIANITIAVFWH